MSWENITYRMLSVYRNVPQISAQPNAVARNMTKTNNMVRKRLWQPVQTQPSKMEKLIGTAKPCSTLIVKLSVFRRIFVTNSNFEEILWIPASDCPSFKTALIPQQSAAKNRVLSVIDSHYSRYRERSGHNSKYFTSEIVKNRKCTRNKERILGRNSRSYVLVSRLSRRSRVRNTVTEISARWLHAPTTNNSAANLEACNKNKF